MPSQPNTISSWETGRQLPAFDPQSQDLQLLADLLGLPAERVNVKVTSTDGLGALGRGEGIAAQAVVLLTHADSDTETGG